MIKKILLLLLLLLSEYAQCQSCICDSLNLITGAASVSSSVKREGLSPWITPCGSSSCCLAQTPQDYHNNFFITNLTSNNYQIRVVNLAGTLPGIGWFVSDTCDAAVINSTNCVASAIPNMSPNIACGTVFLLAGHSYYVYVALLSNSPSVKNFQIEVTNIDLFPSPPISVNFSASDTVICAGECINFYDPPVGGLRSWDFGNGLTSSDHDPTNICYNIPGQYTVEYKFSDCTSMDSATYFNYITVNPLPTANVGTNNSICFGDSISLGGSAVPGNSYHWSPSVNLNSILVSNPVASSDTTTTYTLMETIDITGCQNTNSLEVFVNPEFALNITASICQGETIFLGGAWRSNAGVYIDSLQTIQGCDSIVTTSLILHPNFSITSNTSICNGDSIFLAGMWRTSPSTYIDNFTTVFGCDSIITTFLNVNPVFSDSVFENICAGDSIFLAGNWRTNSGVFINSLNSLTGCDSIVITTLSVNPLPVISILNSLDTLICSPGFITYQWYLNSVIIPGATNRKYLPLSAGSYFVVVTDNAGCEANSVIYNSNVGIKNGIVFGQNSFHVFPNPFSQELIIIQEFSEQEQKLFLYNTHGEEIMQEKIPVNQSQTKLDLTFLPKGIYFLSLRSQQGVATKKIIKM